MNNKRFTDLLDLHGANFARWPADERAAGQDFLSQDERAQAEYERARALDAWLDSDTAGPLPEAVITRVMQSLDTAEPHGAINDNFMGAFLSRGGRGARLRAGGGALLAVAACVMLALFAGVMTRQGVETVTPNAPVLMAAAAADVDLYLLAMDEPLLADLRDEAFIAPFEQAILARNLVEVEAFLDSVILPDAVFDSL